MLQSAHAQKQVRKNVPELVQTISHGIQASFGIHSLKRSVHTTLRRIDAICWRWFNNCIASEAELVLIVLILVITAAKPGQARREAMPCHARPSHVMPNQTKPCQAKLSHAKPSQTRPRQASPAAYCLHVEHK